MLSDRSPVLLPVMAEPPDDPPHDPTRRQLLAEQIRRLEAKDLLLLRRYANFKMFGIVGKVRHADARDLLHEAIRKTLDGTHQWNPQNDLVTHLKQSISTIAYSWSKKAGHLAPWHLQQEELATTPNMEREIMTQDVINGLRKRFKADCIAVLVIEMWQDGYSGPDIQRLLDIDAHAYDAARRRIARALNTFGEEAGDNE